jgi:limonene 1,2-monooxygenase
MRSGIFLPPYHAINENPTLAIDRDLELIEHLDRLDFDEAWIGEHHSGGYEIISSPELFIAAAAQRSKRIRLGTGVSTLAYHNPLTIADRMVLLDHMTKGRAMFGAGPGSLVYDAKMMGIDPARTRDRMIEALDVILPLMRGETVTKKTDWFNLQNAALNVLPYSDPYPELVIASSKTPNGSTAAGRLGVGMICVTAAQPDGFDSLSLNWQIACDEAADHGHTMDRSKLRLVAPVHLAETREQARANVQFGLEKYLEFSLALAPAKREMTKGRDAVGIVTEIRGGVIGTPDDCIELIEKLQAKQGGFGCFLLLAHNWADWEQTKKSYELYARYVIPHIRKANRNREAHFNILRENAVEMARQQERVVSTMFDKYSDLREAKGKSRLSRHG